LHQPEPAHLRAGFKTRLALSGTPLPFAPEERMPRKPHLPVKTCATCGRPFAWRRKWAKVWEEVRHCSRRCRGNHAR